MWFYSMKTNAIISLCMIIGTITGFSTEILSRNRLSAFHPSTASKWCNDIPHRTLPLSKSRHNTALSSSSTNEELETIGKALTSSMEESGVFRDIKLRVGVTDHRLGLISTSDCKAGDVALSVPYDDRFMIRAKKAGEVFDGILPVEYDGWTGDAGLIALLLLNEVARASSPDIQRKPERDSKINSFMSTWVSSLPTIEEMKMHALLWEESLQEELQSSSTKKVYRALDDIEEDATWLEEKIWSQNRDFFPQSVTITDFVSGKKKEVPCFSLEGYTWAMSIVSSRSIFVDGELRLIPIVDYANHSSDTECKEIQGNTYFGAFRTTAGVQIPCPASLKEGDEIFISYGPKNPAEYLLEYGFLPEPFLRSAKATRSLPGTAVAELTFQLNTEDRFHDDKLDILEYDTYQETPMDPVQTFDFREDLDGEPDPSCIQFLRLRELTGKDAFLLESIFRKEVWGFMSAPVSEGNEELVVQRIIGACEEALAEMESVSTYEKDVELLQTSSDNAPTNLCAALRILETRALQQTKEYMQREREALDLKEYYQERRLKDLGLDSEWTPEDGVGGDEDLSWGQTRVPGGGDLDW